MALTNTDQDIRLGTGCAFKCTIFSALTILDSLMAAGTDAVKPPEL